MSVERLLPHFELAYFTGSGFPVNSDASFDSQSYGEKHPVKAKVDSEGNLQFVLMPFVSGQKKGTTTVQGVGMGAPHPSSLSGVSKFDLATIRLVVGEIPLLHVLTLARKVGPILGERYRLTVTQAKRFGRVNFHSNVISTGLL